MLTHSTGLHGRLHPVTVVVHERDSPACWWVRSTCCWAFHSRSCSVQGLLPCTLVKNVRFTRPDLLPAAGRWTR